MAHHCTVCGRALSYNDSFCPLCGNRVDWSEYKKNTTNDITSKININSRLIQPSILVNSDKKLDLEYVIKCVEEFVVDKDYKTEAEYERDFVNWCRGKFGIKNVHQQYSVGNIKIDVIIGDIGVELKLPKTLRELMTLRGQLDVYKKYFGDNLIVVIFNGKVVRSELLKLKDDLDKKRINVILK